MRATCPHCKKSFTLRQDGCLPKHSISMTGWMPGHIGSFGRVKVVIQKTICPKSRTKPE